MYGLYWFIGIILLIAAVLVWLDALLKRRRKGEADLFAAKNLIVLGVGGVALAVLGAIAYQSGVPAADMMQVQYYLSNRFRWEIGESIRALLGYCAGQTLSLIVGSAFLVALGLFIRALHPRLEAVKDRALAGKWDIAAHVIRYAVPVLSCVFLPNLFAKKWLGLEKAHRYIASEGFFLTANPADMWHFHSLAIYALCLLVPYFILKYWARMTLMQETAEKQAILGLKLLPFACAVMYFLIRVLTPVLGVTLYALLVSLLAAMAMGCFDPNHGVRRRGKKAKAKARYTPCENEILDLMSRDLTWVDSVEPSEARRMASKMKELGDDALTPEIFARLEKRGQEE